MNRLFCNQLKEEGACVVVSGQVTSCQILNEQLYGMSICDGFGCVEFLWDKRVEVGSYVEIMGKFTVKQYNMLKINKIFANRIRILYGSNQYMQSLLETIYEQQQQQQLKSQVMPISEFENLQISKVFPCILITHLASFILKQVGNAYCQGEKITNPISINKFDYELNELISQYPRSDYEQSIKSLKYIGLLINDDKVDVNLDSVFKLLDYLTRSLKHLNVCTIKQCTSVINKQFALIYEKTFNDGISHCLFNIFLLNHFCIEQGPDSIQWIH